MNRFARVAGIVVALLVWVAMVVLMGLDHAPADGAIANRRPAPCFGQLERQGVDPGTPRAVVERRAGVRGAGVPMRKLDDQLVHGVAYLTCSGRRVVVLYFDTDETVASVILA